MLTLIVLLLMVLGASALRVPRGRLVPVLGLWAAGSDFGPGNGERTKLGDIEILGGRYEGRSANPPSTAVEIPPPLHLLVDVNLERRSVLYEVVLGRDVGFDVVQSKDGNAKVGKVGKERDLFTTSFSLTD